ncbi:Peptide chain release factor 1 [Paramuricea clavata]|uniref:Peptide chain release factor 1 n=1 Tax=Paramuricea clavata TaxID=317549 RepID=A0A7D9LHT7_PARCT|nr:Peptide chain release factor 1 [Paramuricea clavata]
MNTKMHLFCGTVCGRLYRYSFLKHNLRWLKNASYLQATEKSNDLKLKFESNSGIEEYLKHVVEQHSELTQLLTSQGSGMKADKRRSLGKTLSKYSPLVGIVKKINQKQEALAELDQLALEDKEMKELAQEERIRCQQELNDIKDVLFDNLVPAEDEDNNDVILEVRAGTGGQEACLFTMEMFQMYQKFSSNNQWRFSTIHINKSETGGFKEASASISGSGVFGNLKYEIGVHRVQRVPATEAMGRLHTSTMTVAVLPEPEEIDITLNQQDLKIDTFRSSGAGGQHVNTTDSAVRITHLPTGIVVSNQDERSQIKNKQKALRVLRAKLFQLQRETADMERSVARKRQIGTAERSEKIRTYNFPQNRVTDHRAGVSSKNIEDFLKGGEELRHMITVLQSHYRNNALEHILQEYKKE